MIPPVRRGGYRQRTLRETLSGSFYLDLGTDHRDTVLLAGSGRSGTSFVSDAVAAGGNFRHIFEPFHPQKVRASEVLGRKPYLSPDDADAGNFAATRRILCGEVRNGWSDRFNRKFLARRRLVKDIRVNLMLGWMHARFPRMPMVILLRHPCAVTDSRLRLGWRDDLPEIMSRKELVGDHLLPFEGRISAARDSFERSVYLWCIENHVPLVQLAEAIERGEIHLVRYEDLLTKPETEFGRLFSYLGLEMPDGLMGEMAKLPREDLIGGWKERIPPDRRAWTAGTLRLFGLDGIYGEDGPQERLALPTTGAGVAERDGR